MNGQVLDIEKDITSVNSLSVVPLILNVICHTTGMGFAAVARVTRDRWVACSVLDNVQFGLSSGGELEVETTICHEIRQSGSLVVIDHVIVDEIYQNHHTPAKYGLQSYISVPIVTQQHGFFGTLCAIDAKPALLNTPEVIGMFKAFANVIALQLNAMELLPTDKLSSQDQHISAELNGYLKDLLLQPPAQLSATGPNQRGAHSREMILIAAQKVNDLTRAAEKSLAEEKRHSSVS